MKPYFKFNNGNGAILCHECHIIIKDNISEDDAMKSNILFCERCLNKRYSIYLDKCKILGIAKTNIANKDYFRKFINLYLTYQPKKHGRHKFKYKRTN